MKALKKIWNFLLTFERVIMIVASILVVVLIVTTVVMRYLLEKNFPGMEELVIMVAFWIYFMGGTMCSYENSHITADILTVFIKNEKAKEIIEFLRYLISAAVLVGASYCAVELIVYTVEAQPVSPVLHMPMMVTYLPMLAGIFLMTFYTFVHLIEKTVNMFGRKNKEVAL